MVRALINILQVPVLYVPTNPRPLVEDSWRFRDVAMYDTHPQIGFEPQPFSTFCDSHFLGFCAHYSVAWISKAFTTSDGSITSYHLLDIPNSSDLPPLTATATFKGAAVLSIISSLIQLTVFQLDLSLSMACQNRRSIPTHSWSLYACA
jgi:hypothetical protein